MGVAMAAGGTCAPLDRTPTAVAGIAGGTTVAAGGHVASGVCARNAPAAQALDRLEDAMARGRFVAYEPTALQVVNGRASRADAASIRADLQVLRPRFDSLITYGSIDGAEQIPGVASALGFRTVIVGVWDPFNRQQLDSAVAAARAHPDVVVGFSLGNELVMAGRHSFAELATLIADVRRRLPWIAVSTTEPFHMFYDPAAAGLLQQLDFLLVNVHPVFQSWFRDAPDANAARFVVNVVTRLQGGYCGPVLVKETGVPTAPSELGFTPQRQASFFAQLGAQFQRTRTRSFAYFSAFDAPWRAYDEMPVAGAQPTAAAHTAEAHWGLFDEHRRPKPVIAQIALLPAASH
jgi:exo-beta-1,3-glucanase (GH17 family)